MTTIGVSENTMMSNETTALLAKLDGEFISGVTSATPNTETAFAHTLGREPKGFLIVDIDKAGIVYKGASGADENEIYLAGSVASIAFKAYVF